MRVGVFQSHLYKPQLFSNGISNNGAFRPGNLLWESAVRIAATFHEPKNEVEREWTGGTCLTNHRFWSFLIVYSKNRFVCSNQALFLRNTSTPHGKLKKESIVFSKSKMPCFTTHVCCRAGDRACTAPCSCCIQQGPNRRDSESGAPSLTSSPVNRTSPIFCQVCLFWRETAQSPGSAWLICCPAPRCRWPAEPAASQQY